MYLENTARDLDLNILTALEIQAKPNLTRKKEEEMVNTDSLESPK